MKINEKTLHYGPSAFMSNEREYNKIFAQSVGAVFSDHNQIHLLVNDAYVNIRGTDSRFLQTSRRNGKNIRHKEKDNSSLGFYFFVSLILF